MAASASYISALAELAQHMDIQKVTEVKDLNMIQIFKDLAARGADELIREIMLYLKDYHDDESSPNYLDRLRCLYDAAYYGHWSTIETLLELYESTYIEHVAREYVLEGAIHADNRDILRRCMNEPRFIGLFDESIFPHLEFCVAYRKHFTLFILLSFFEGDELYLTLKKLLDLCLCHLNLECFKACWAYSPMTQEFAEECRATLENYKSKGFVRPEKGIAHSSEFFTSLDIEQSIKEISELLCS